MLTGFLQLLAPCALLLHPYSTQRHHDCSVAPLEKKIMWIGSSHHGSDTFPVIRRAHANVVACGFKIENGSR